ncbi:hypothetical protein EVAR_30810_1 [Eumeta japonica]|uniref:Uncharacterized protein n=1 Tax=Eumeta variegata TaxID=151549 RepID=A0A4C1V742_EUMVA|nr:hypothetical protein EVAR_30810_1 [Eumeta japonica]
MRAATEYAITAAHGRPQSEALIKYHTFTEYECEVAAIAVEFRPVSEFRWPAPPHFVPSIRSNFVRYFIPSRDVGNALVISLGLRVFVGWDDHILSDGSSALRQDISIQGNKAQLTTLMK